MPEIPRKPYYKPSEVCALTDTQPYVLKFWESEFPQLAPKKGVYRREDIDLVLRIKQMLNEEDCTISEVRTALESGGGSAARAARSKKQASAAKAPTARKRKPEQEPEAEAEPHARASRGTRAKAVLPFADRPSATADTDLVPRRRYEDALDEIAHLRLELQEAESLRRRAEHDLEEAREENERLRDRSESAIENIEQLIRRLT